ncbi:MAG: class I SAM-dependent methyltransferase [Sciscionella sp.]|nr:class I SAM-dependent methyltransferase [Sciscionella sp.]
MPVLYPLLYRFKLTPWDSERGNALAVDRLRTLVEGPDALPPGRALDIGCGPGAKAVYLAERGWQVTGVDQVDRALAVARRRATDAGVTLDLHQADVARLGDLGLSPGFSLLYDIGCFHHLEDGKRAAVARALAGLAAPSATLLIFAFAPSRGPIGPRGVTAADVHRWFDDDWTLAETEPETDPDIPLVARRMHPTWYRLTRTS